MASGTANSPATRVGPYVLEQELGRGAFGIVYRGHHADRPATPLAIKRIESQGNLDRLLLEPEILSKLRHPGIVSLEDYFRAESEVVIVLEFIAGKDLKDRVDQQGVLSPREVREFLRQMASALQHAHAQGVLHRDIKLPNILVEMREGGARYVLADFGISRIAQGIQTAKRTGGTYQFMAPEQLRGRPTPQSDLWSLGVVAYVLLTGALPFKGDTLEDLSREILYVTPQTFGQRGVAAAGDEELERIVFELLEKHLNDRIGSADELLRRLGQGPTGAMAQLPAPTASSTYEQQLERTRSRYTWLAAVSFLLLSGPFLIVGQILSMTGLYLFYRSQFSQGIKRVGSTALAWLLLIPGLFVGLLLPPVFLLLAGVFSLIFTPLLLYSISKVRRLKRDLVLRRAVTQNSSAPAQYLAMLEDFCEVYDSDIGLHQRYIEALIARRRLEDAVVEAKVLLLHDPYNFGANLLLAQAYFDLGLLPQCVAVCDSYLAVTGYCFEFKDLRSQAQPQGERTA